MTNAALERAAARVCWITVHGATADAPHPENRRAYGVDTPAEVIRRYRPGGVVLFAWAANTEHPAQVAALIADLRAAAGGQALGVGIDEEGGRVTRLGPPATAFPSARAVAAADDADLSLRRWLATGAELAALGVTADFAPVVDLGEPTNPVLGDRTFGDGPSVVAEQAALAVQGLERGGVAAVAKHFPGHGATSVDSHEALPVVEATRAELDPHLDVYRRLFAAAAPSAVMSGHLLVRALDPGVPATLSRMILTDLLRREMGYEGAIVTDSLSMAGIRAHAGDAEVAVAALAAGADVLLTPPDLPAAVTTIAQAVRAGRLDEARLADALDRAGPLVGRTARTPGDHAEHRALAATIAERALEVTGEWEPAADDRHLLVTGVAGAGARVLADTLRAHGHAVTLLEFAPPARSSRLADAGQADVDQTTSPAEPDSSAWGPAALLRHHRGTVVFVRRVPEVDAAAQDAALDTLLEAQKRVVLVEAGTVVAAAGTRCGAVVRTHCASAPSLRAAAAWFSGHIGVA